MQGFLCPSCGAMAPVNAVECSECGTSLSAPQDRTQAETRIDDQAGHTIDDSADDDGFVFRSQKRTAPHQLKAVIVTPEGSPPPRRSNPSAAPDSSIPFRGGGAAKLDADPNDPASKDTGPELEEVRPPVPPPPSPRPSPARKSMGRAPAPTGCAPAIERAEPLVRAPDVLAKAGVAPVRADAGTRRRFIP